LPRKWQKSTASRAETGNNANNGKAFLMCRYMEVFDENKEVLHWDYQAEQMMFVLHDKLGNKWAAIGQQLNNRYHPLSIIEPITTSKTISIQKFAKASARSTTSSRTISKNKSNKSNKPSSTKSSKVPKTDLTPLPSTTLTPGLIAQVPNPFLYLEAKNFLLKMSYDEEEYNPWENFYKYAH
jgi:hypothetical protein